MPWKLSWVEKRLLDLEKAVGDLWTQIIWQIKVYQTNEHIPQSLRDTQRTCFETKIVILSSHCE